jgi:hypothetical protein
VLSKHVLSDEAVYQHGFIRSTLRDCAFRRLDD